MADYELAESGVRRLADNASIPADPENRDWQTYLEWEAAGGVPNPMPEPPVDETAALREQAIA
jgi:hypothetical protein